MSTQRTGGEALPGTALARLHAELERHRNEDAIKERQLERYAKALRDSYMATVRALSNALEARDAYTAHHAERVAAYAMEIAAARGLVISEHPQMEFGFLLHDIGKVGVPDAILFKPGALDPSEREVVERHPVIGDEIIREIEFLGPARDVVRHHHERWDGEGYPDRLRGEEIPLAARVFALADALDALTSDRPYRAATDVEDARARLREAAGQFDPEILEAFETIATERIEAIRASLR